jgi:hypothetical protein
VQSGVTQTDGATSNGAHAPGGVCARATCRAATLIGRYTVGACRATAAGLKGHAQPAGSGGRLTGDGAAPPVPGTPVMNVTLMGVGVGQDGEEPPPHAVTIEAHPIASVTTEPNRRIPPS